MSSAREGFRKGDLVRSNCNDKYIFEVIEVDVMGRPCKVRRQGSERTQTGWWEGVKFTLDRGRGGRRQERRPAICDNVTSLGEYMYAVEEKVKKGLKTKRWSIRNKTSRGLLGTVKWHGPWRQYCFYPELGAFFNSKCLDEIQEFLEQEKKFQRDRG